MDFNRAQQALEVLQVQCPRTDQKEIAVWISAITRAREVLFELQVAEDELISSTRDGRPLEANPHLVQKELPDFLDVQMAELYRNKDS